MKELCTLLGIGAGLCAMYYAVEEANYGGAAVFGLQSIGLLYCANWYEKNE